MTTNPRTLSLDGKVALVTGGGKGMGAAIAKTFAANGAAIAVVARTVSQVEAVASKIRADEGRAMACPEAINRRIFCCSGVFASSVTSGTFESCGSFFSAICTSKLTVFFSIQSGC